MSAAAEVPEFTLADRLRKAREVAGLEQSELAERLGVKPQTVSHYERGLRQPRNLLAVLQAYERETGVPVTWLLGVGTTTYEGPFSDAPPPPPARLRAVEPSASSAR